MQNKERVIAYIDGFNLYFGMLEAGHDKLKWLNIKKLIESLLRHDQALADIFYFTSRVRNNPNKERRQSLFIDAIEGTAVKVIYGRYQANTQECYRCGNV
ncbi:MAG: NYN domain-containing protein [Bacteroidales bacterium]|nr:NYN domain-containing protein [Bacteroidales bacterium]MDZ4203337.1 NYN domain-containing protein [Bacteroidales bacterium]